MANLKLSELPDGNPAVAATDKVVAVRDVGGGDFEDVLVTPVTLDAAQTWTGDQTFDNSTIKLKGSDTGVTTFASANSGATDYTMNVPAANDTLAAIAAAQTLSNKTLTDPIETNGHRCTAQLDKTDDTLADVTGLVQTVVPGTYIFRINLDTISTANGGVQAAFKYTDTVVSALNALAKYIDAAAISAERFTGNADQDPIADQLVATVSLEITGTMVVTTGGTVQLQFAQNTTHVDTSSVLVGSSMEFIRIA